MLIVMFIINFINLAGRAAHPDPRRGVGHRRAGDRDRPVRREYLLYSVMLCFMDIII